MSSLRAKNQELKNVKIMKIIAFFMILRFLNFLPIFAQKNVFLSKNHQKPGFRRVFPGFDEKNLRGKNKPSHFADAILS